MSEKKDSTSDLPVWKCELPDLKADTSWTVGGKQLLSCRGDYIEKLVSPVQIEVIESKAKEPAQQSGMGAIPPQEDPYKNYKLKVLSEKSIGNDHIDVVVTSYRAGEHSNLQYKIVGQKGGEIKVEPMNFQVASVMTEQNKNGFGPTQPILLEYPLWYWLGLGGVLFFVLMAFVVKIYFFVRWEKVKAEMKSYASNLGPGNQYYKEIRALKYKYKYTDLKPLSPEEKQQYWLDFEKAFKVFLINQFRVPALRWGNRRTIGAVSEHHMGRFAFRLTSHLKRILNEFEKGRKLKNNELSPEDFEHMNKTCQAYIELVKKVEKNRGAS